MLETCKENPYLMAIRNGLTLTLPIVIAGIFAVLLNTFPLAAYQNYMLALFGPQWQLFGEYLYKGTIGVLSVIMALSIGHGLSESYNANNPLDKLPSALFSFVIFSCLMITIEPIAGGTALELRWLGVHGLLLGILVAVFSCYLFCFFLRFSWLRVSIFSSNNSGSISQALTAMFPVVITLGIFAGCKMALYVYGVVNPNLGLYNWLYSLFAPLGEQTLVATNLYGIARHALWFIGQHGSNILEPIMQEFYVSAMSLNTKLVNTAIPDPRAYKQFFQLLYDHSSPYAIATKPFFDCFTSIGGAGSTFGLLVACLLQHNDNNARKIAKISLLPSIFNINEILLFGLPLILNPVFFVPFMLVPVLTTTTAYLAIAWGIVPPTTHDVAWNVPIFLNGYLSTGSIRGAVLQLMNIVLAGVVYMPFVRLDNELRERSLRRNFHDLVKAAEEDSSAAEPGLIYRPGRVGNLAVSLANDLQHALRKGQLFMEYQPQVNSDNGKVYGVESLMRWLHPEIGRVPPAVFIAIAEDTGFINKLGDFALEESMRQASVWRQAGIVDIIMSVNVSAIQLGNVGFPAKVRSLLKRYGLPADSLKLEVTESVALTLHGTQHTVLNELYCAGIPLAIDDFGMGQSSIAYLKKYPISSLKVDAVLSRDVLTSSCSCEIITSIADLCENLHVHLVAEAVEEEQQLQKLRSLGCSNIQGYFYSKPLPPQECFIFMQQCHKAFGPRCVKRQ